MSGQYCLYCSAVIIHVGNHRNVPAKMDEQSFVEKLSGAKNIQLWGQFRTPAHRYHLLFLALLGQVLDAVDKELVGADVGPAGLNHPTAQLHQLAGSENKNNHFKYTTKNTVYLKSHMFYTVWHWDINRRSGVVNQKGKLKIIVSRI